MPEGKAAVILHEMSADEEMCETPRLREKAILGDMPFLRQPCVFAANKKLLISVIRNFTF